MLKHSLASTVSRLQRIPLPRTSPTKVGAHPEVSRTHQRLRPHLKLGTGFRR